MGTWLWDFSITLCMNIKHLSVTPSLFLFLFPHYSVNFLQCTLYAFHELQVIHNKYIYWRASESSLNNKWTLFFSFFQELCVGTIIGFIHYCIFLLFFFSFVRLKMWPRYSIGSSRDMHRGHQTHPCKDEALFTSFYYKVNWVV